MAERISRILFFLLIVAGSIRLSAQAASSDIGVWVVASNLEKTTEFDEGDELTLDFDEDNGYGLSFNHFWTDQFSTEFAWQTINARIKFTTDFTGTPLTFDAGEIHADTFTAMAQWHFNRAGRFSPYLGGGVAHLSGEIENNAVQPVPPFPGEEPEIDDSFDLKSETALAASIGANIRLRNNLYLTTDFKYIPWEAMLEGEPDDEGTDVNPMLWSIGLKTRF
jgi:outer membrane protein W